MKTMSARFLLRRRLAKVLLTILGCLGILPLTIQDWTNQVFADPQSVAEVDSAFRTSNPSHFRNRALDDPDRVTTVYLDSDRELNSEEADSESLGETAAVEIALKEDALQEDVPASAAGWSREEALIAALTIFVLAIFVGFEVITKVPPTLHTPLMSGSNAISGITVVGAVLMAGSSGSWFAIVLGFLAVVLATINVAGGFLVTDRMLAMFKRK